MTDAFANRYRNAWAGSVRATAWARSCAWPAGCTAGATTAA